MTVDRRVLIVDDNVDFVDSLRDALEAEDYQVATANNALDAVAVADTFAAHVALLDIRLPIESGDGLDLLATLKQKRPDMLCVIMTAYADVETAIRALQGDAYDYLCKPLYPHELTSALTRCFERIDLEWENRQAAAALREYAERLETLRRIDQAIIETQSPEEIARATLRYIRRLVPCVGASIVTLDPDAREATLLAADVDGSSAAQETAVSFSLAVLGDTESILSDLRQGQFYVIGDAESSHVASVLQSLGGADAAVVLGAPLVFQESLLGFLALGVERSEALGQEHTEIIWEVVNQLAVAIQNARLLETERRRRVELEALHQASLHLTSSLEPQPVLSAIIEHALKLVSADNTHIFLYDGESLTFGAAMWDGEQQQAPYADPRPQGLTYAVARGGEKIIVPDVNAHPLFEERRWGGAIASLPLCFGGEVCGVMNVAFERPHVFDDNELNLLELLADQAAIAIHNAELHQQVRMHAQELADALARQEELDHLKGEFIQNVSHELRSPLALVRGYAEMLADGDLGELQPDQQKPVAIIARRAQMLGDLVEDITLILGAETRPLEPVPVALGEMARTAMDDFRVAADQAELALEVEVEPDLPPVCGSVLYLRRVLDNLVGNAIKFTPPGGTVTVRVWQEEEQIALRVKDTGIGIPDDQLERIFERFYQVDGSTRRRYGGVGLGLALVKEIVDLHAGQVIVESWVDEGSAFTVKLPVFKPSSCQDRQGAS